MSAPHPPFIDLNYEVLTKLREGGMGAVYKVRHRLLDQTRIIKVIRPHLSSDEEMGERFLQEARAASRVRHPNIALLLDFRVDRDGHEMLVMEYIDGSNLLEILERSGPPPLGLTLEMARQTLSALGYLHRLGLVHRDVSPDNLMLTRGQEGEPVVKLIDLGIAKLPAGDQQGLTQAGVFLGKPLYASPEQFLGEGELDARSDLYSFGVVLYQMSTGRLPFTGRNRRELKTAHLFHPPLDFAESDPQGRIPEDLRRLVLRLLAKDPAERIASAQDAADRLAQMAHRIPFSPGDLALVLDLPSGASDPGVNRETPSAIATRPEPVVPAPMLPLGEDTAETHRVETVLAGASREESPPREATTPAAPPSWTSRRVALPASLLLALLLSLLTYGAQRWRLSSPDAPPVSSAPDTAAVAPEEQPSSPVPPPSRTADAAPAGTRAPAAAAPTKTRETQTGPRREEEPATPDASVRAEPRSTPADPPVASETSIDAEPGPEGGPPPSPPEPLPDSPPRALDPPRPVYPFAALDSGRSVQVTVEVLIGETGEVLGTPSIKGLISDEASTDVPAQRRGTDPYNALFRAAAIEAVRKTRFAPAIREGAPVQERATLVFEIAPPPPPPP